MLPHAYASEDSFNLIPCGKTLSDPCTFKDLLELGSNVIDALIVIVIFFMLFMLLRAGWKYLGASGNPAVLNDAKKSFTKIALGILAMLAGWLVINFIVKSVVDTQNFDNPLESKTATQQQR